MAVSEERFRRNPFLVLIEAVDSPETSEEFVQWYTALQPGRKHYMASCSTVLFNMSSVYSVTKRKRAPRICTVGLSRQMFIEYWTRAHMPASDARSICLGRYSVKKKLQIRVTGSYQRFRES